METKTPLQRAIEEVGSATALANLLGITKGAISQWKDHGRSIPFEYGAAIEAATCGKVTRQELFPDDWPRLWPELVLQAESKISHRSTDPESSEGRARRKLPTRHNVMTVSTDQPPKFTRRHSDSLQSE